jgi:formyl-CoA transferase
MFESTVSWLTVPITLSQSFGNKITRRGNTHEFFSPVSVFPTVDGYVYIAVGNDKQWGTLTEVPEFASLAKENYKKNAGRIADVKNLNQGLTAVLRKFKTGEVISLFNKLGLPISEINSMDQVARDPQVAKNLLKATDPKTGTELTLAPAPNMTDYLRSVNQRLSFPPRFGEQNPEIYGKILGYSEDQLKSFKEKGVI